MAADADGLLAEPALLQHCEELYKAMMKEAEEQYQDGTTLLVYEGFLTKLVQKLGMPTPYYTYIRRALLRMDCIRQLRRGGGSTPSQWLLVQEPSLVLFQSSRADFVTKTKTDDRLDTIEQQLRDLNRRVTELERFRRSVGG
jgi:hypothetical protein